MQIVRERGFRPRTVGLTDFGNKAPLFTARDVMSQCSGAIILGLAQTTVGVGLRKAGTSAEGPIRDADLPTPWNDLEAGMAFVLGLPLFVVRESSVTPQGIFDSAVADHFVHHADLTSRWLESAAFRQPFEAWATDVAEHVSALNASTNRTR